MTRAHGPTTSPRREAGTPAAGAWILLPFLALLALFAAGCGEQAPVTRIEKGGNSPDQILWQFTTSASDSGRLTWTFTGDKALVFQQGREIQASGIRIELYGEGGLLRSTLTADSGRIERRAGEMSAWGDVYVISREDYELWTDTLHWDQERELFHTEAFVEVQQERNLYSGFDMECDQDLGHLVIRREFKALLVQEEADGE